MRKLIGLWGLENVTEGGWHLWGCLVSFFAAFWTLLRAWKCYREGGDTYPPFLFHLFSELNKVELDILWVFVCHSVKTNILITLELNEFWRLRNVTEGGGHLWGPLVSFLACCVLRTWKCYMGRGGHLPPPPVSFIIIWFQNQAKLNCTFFQLLCVI